MLNLDVYTVSTLQDMSALLTQFEAESVTDIRFVREQLHKHLHSRRLASRNISDKAIRRKAAEVRTAKKCPDCGKPMKKSSFYPALTCPFCLHSEEI